MLIPSPQPSQEGEGVQGVKAIQLVVSTSRARMEMDQVSLIPDYRFGLRISLTDSPIAAGPTAASMTVNPITGTPVQTFAASELIPPICWLSAAMLGLVL